MALSKEEFKVLTDAFAFYIISGGQDGDDGFYEDAETDTEDTPLNRLCGWGYMERGSTVYVDDGIRGHASITLKGIEFLYDHAMSIHNDALEVEEMLSAQSAAFWPEWGE